MELEDYLAVPYVLVSYSAVDTDGVWKRFAEYPELGCTVQADTAVEAVAIAERARARTIVDLVERGEHVPVPRPPLSALRYEARQLLAQIAPDAEGATDDAPRRHAHRDTDR